MSRTCRACGEHIAYDGHNRAVCSDECKVRSGRLHYREPDPRTVANSVQELMHQAQQVAERDHGGSVGQRERLRLAQVYLRRAWERLEGECDE